MSPLVPNSLGQRNELHRFADYRINHLELQSKDGLVSNEPCLKCRIFEGLGVVHEKRDTTVNLKKMTKPNRPCNVVDAIKDGAWL